MRLTRIDFMGAASTVGLRWHWLSERKNRHRLGSGGGPWENPAVPPTVETDGCRPVLHVSDISTGRARWPDPGEGTALGGSDN